MFFNSLVGVNYAVLGYYAGSSGNFLLTYGTPLQGSRINIGKILLLLTA